MQLLIVNTDNKTLEVYVDDKLIKVINDVWIGQNGVSEPEEMIEGNQKTPLGLYNLGVAFGTHNLDINYPYFKIKNNDYWVDDINSKHYNYMVRLKEDIDNFGYDYIIREDEKDFSSAEHLLDYEMQYEYSVFIEYNIENQIVNGKGNGKSSAIFLHCHGTKGYTGGCVALKKEDMEYIINLLDRRKEPKILIK